MISEIWTLRIVGPVTEEVRTLAAWGIESCVIERGDLMPGTMTFTVPVARAVERGVFSHLSPATLYRNGSRYWSGKLTDPRSVIQSRSEVQTFRAIDPFYFFSALPAHQAWMDGFTDTLREYGRMLFFARWDPTLVEGVPIGLQPKTVGEEITELFATVLQDLLDGGDSDPFEPTIMLGTIDDGVRPKPIKVENIYFFDALTALTRFDPSRVTWWDYSTPAGPGLNSRLTASLETVTLSFPLKRLVIGPWRDGNVSVVIVRSKHIEEVPGLTPDDPITFDSVVRVTTYPEGYAGTRLGSVQITVEETEFYGPTAQAELAEQMWSQCQSIGWQGEVELHEQDCSGRLAMGKKLNITGGDPAWATMGIPIRSVVENIAEGITTAKFGPPARLAAADLMEMILPYNRSIPASESEIQASGSGKADDSGDPAADPTFRLQVINNGARAFYRVKGTYDGTNPT